MHDPERAITVGSLPHDDAEAEDVRQLLEGKRLRLHLAEDRIRLLLATLHLGVEALFAKQGTEFLLDLHNEVAILVGEVPEPVDDRLVGLRVHVAEGELLQLVAHVLHAHAAGERRIDLHRLLGDAGALFLRHEIERAHVVQAIGELDQQHAHVVGDGKQELAQVFRLLCPLGDKIELLQLRQPLDQCADVLPEERIDLVAGGGRVLDRVVQQRDRDGRLVEMHVGQDGGDLEGVGDVRVAARARLLAVLLHGVDIGLVEQGLVGVRLVFLHALHELVLPHHVAPAPSIAQAVALAFALTFARAFALAICPAPLRGRSCIFHVGMRLSVEHGCPPVCFVLHKFPAARTKKNAPADERPAHASGMRSSFGSGRRRSRCSPGVRA